MESNQFNDPNDLGRFQREPSSKGMATCYLDSHGELGVVELGQESEQLVQPIEFFTQLGDAHGMIMFPFDMVKNYMVKPETMGIHRGVKDRTRGCNGNPRPLLVGDDTRCFGRKAIPLQLPLNF